MATDVFYNGIELRNVLTREFDQSPVRDSSGTDQIYQRFVISVECICNADLLADANPNLGLIGPGGGSAGAVAAATRKILSQDRKSFTYRMEGVAVLSSGFGHDVNNGPKVRDIKVTHISAATLKILFSIEVCITDCEDQENPLPVLNNRWSCVDDIDESFRITRTWTGKLRVSVVDNNPHGFRGLCVPRVQRGWKRTRMRFGSDPTGLELSYEITDRQMLGESPLEPGVKMTIVHTEAMTKSGAHNTAELVVRIEGHRASSKQNLITAVTRVIYAKLELRNFTNDSGTFDSLIIVDYSGDDANTIEGRAQVTRTLPVTAIVGLGEAIGNVSIVGMNQTLEQTGAIPGYDEDRPIAVGPYGLPPFSLAGLFACYLQTPCNPEHAMPQLDDVDPDSTDYDLGDEEPPEVEYTNQLFNYLDHPSQNDEHRENMYSYSRMESILKMSSNRVQLPIAMSSGMAANNDTSSTIDLAPRTCRRILRMSFERVGAWPVIWTPEDFTDSNGIKYKLIDWTPNARPPESLSDGRMQYALDAEYEFAMNRAPRTGENIATVALPWDNFTSTASTHVLTGRAFTPLAGPKGAQ